jgi:hypothetical protein
MTTVSRSFELGVPRRSSSDMWRTQVRNRSCCGVAPNHLALPHCRKTGRRRHGCRVQGRGHPYTVLAKRGRGRPARVRPSEIRGRADNYRFIFSQVWERLHDRKFPKRRQAQINFVADSLAGLGRIAPRRSRDICADERAKAKRAHHIIRYEVYVECSCGYKGRSRNHACPKCRTRIDFGFGSIFGQ